MSDGPVIVIIDDIPGRRRLEPLSAADQAARELERLDAVAEFAAEAEERGWCVACWVFATDAGRFPRLGKRTRHRRPQNCPRFLK